MTHCQACGCSFVVVMGPLWVRNVREGRVALGECDQCGQMACKIDGVYYAPR